MAVYAIGMAVSGSAAETSTPSREQDQAELEQRYAAILPKMPETADGNWKMAEWCQKKKLADKAEFHWQAVIQHDPDHLQARQRLGYTRIKAEWVKWDEVMKSRGYVWEQGRWRLPQEIAISQRREEMERADKEWRQKIRMWRGWLDSNRGESGRQQILEIRDPAATSVLADLFRQESSRSVKLLYVEVLKQLPGAATTQTLVRGALHDNDVEVRAVCMEHLLEMDREVAYQEFLRALQSGDRTLVNRAAGGLKLLKNPAAIGPLIEVLTAREKVVIQQGDGNQFNLEFGGGGTGFGVGGGKKTVDRQVENPKVLDALLSLTKGADFQYDRDAWRAWYANQRTPPRVDLRRGP